MKIFFISDIHGSIDCLNKAMEQFRKEEANYIVVLGDALYHGPRNNIPSSYNPKEVVGVLNTYKDKIIAVRGNCDSEVDQMLIEYPMMSDYSIILHKGKRLFLTHGHIYNRENLPNIGRGDILVHGHTHIPVAEKIENGIIVFNPGSITIPKENNPNSYGVLEGNMLKVKDLEGNTIREISME